MAERQSRRQPRILPAYHMDKPASDPISEQEADGLAQSAVLSGASGTSPVITDAQVHNTLALFSTALYQTSAAWKNYV